MTGLTKQQSTDREADFESRIRTLRFAHASMMRAQAEALRLESRSYDLEADPEDHKAHLEAEKVVRETHATLLDLQAAFVEKFGLKALEEQL